MMVIAERMTRAEQIETARRLRAQGHAQRGIADLLGVSQTTIVRWTNDEYAERSRATARVLKDSYRGTCVDCGAPTNGCNGPGKASQRCNPCNRARQTAEATWTRERMITDAFRWHRLVGRWPTSTDWHRSLRSVPSASRGLVEALEEFHALTGPWPWQQEVCRHFGSWAAFMAAVGGTAPGTCAGVRHGQREQELRAATQRARKADNG